MKDRRQLSGSSNSNKMDFLFISIGKNAFS